MAQKIEVLMIDDMDGSTAVENVSFALDGKSFEIDLNEENANKLRTALHPYMEKARRERARTATKTAARQAGSRERSAEIRAWAKGNGIEVNERGRIPAKVIEQYEAANG
ncbi:Lsr2 family protein [Actinomadura sp. 9N407]|uniref:Lsr2 family protein n=1 Tax=Actinomadura sp. 9N407 TaxID=3375154 RepID=UPI00378AE7FB